MARRGGSVAAIGVLIQSLKSTQSHRYYQKTGTSAVILSHSANLVRASQTRKSPCINLTRALLDQGLINLIGATAMTQNNKIDNEIPASYKAKAILNINFTLAKALLAKRGKSND